MHTVEFTLVLLACVIASAVLAQVVRHLSLPLVQIVAGVVVACIVPAVYGVDIPAELFLALFIAPLLFDEARNINRRALWENKGAIFSLAVGLVLLTVLVVGFVLHWFVPSIPLTAAFACAAALAPTDAAAVGALGSRVGLKPRQSTLLAGESLINDASGVVAFQFAIAAALTGVFSATDAAVSFARLFFGGIAVGAVLGATALLCMRLLRRRGFEGTTVHVLYEVFTPFFVFLFAEWLDVSGILAVVAAGLAMADPQPRLTSSEAAQRRMVSNTFWKIIVFTINSVVFVLLGMQLPRALSPAFADHFSLPFLLGLVTLATVLVVACRFLWVLAMELVHRDRGAPVLRDALILTIAGPKGAVTLSIIFLIPPTLADGSAFPERDLLIFLTASVILCTLLLADGLLPRLAPLGGGGKGASATELRRGTIKVLEGTLRELRAMLQNDDDPQLEPALRQTIASYRLRLNRERGALDDTCSRQMDELQAEVRRRQQQKADAIGGEAYGGESPRDRASFYAMLRAVRRSVGYSGTDVKVGARFGGLLGRVALLWQGAKPLEVEGDEAERLYYDACLFAIELEHGAIDFLEEAATDEGRQRAARLLLDEHKTALNSLWNRINYGQEVKQADHTGLTLVHHDGLPAGMRPLFGKQLLEAARYADEVDADALTIELDQIRHLQEDGAISESVAQQLRQRVYVLQITLGD